MSANQEFSHFVSSAKALMQKIATAEGGKGLRGGEQASKRRSRKVGADRASLQAFRPARRRSDEKSCKHHRTCRQQRTSRYTDFRHALHRHVDVPSTSRSGDNGDGIPKVIYKFWDRPDYRFFGRHAGRRRDDIDLGIIRHSHVPAILRRPIIRMGPLSDVLFIPR